MNIEADQPTVELSIVMPAFNEAAILGQSMSDVVTGLRARGGTFEIIVVENGSSDATLTIAHDLERLYPEVRVESLPRANYGAALRHGLLHAVAPVVVNFDCDYYDIDFLSRAVAMVTPPDGPAVVVGSKRGHGADDKRALPRRLVTMVFTTILRLGFGLQVSDTHGMKAMRRGAVVDAARRCQLGRDLFDTELILRVERAGLPTSEVPVTVEERRPARTSILRRVPRTLIGLAKLWIVIRRTEPRAANTTAVSNTPR